MANYALNYNDIFDDYLVQAEPVKKPEVMPEAKPSQPELRRIGRTKQQVIEKNIRKFKIDLLKFSFVLAAFIAVISMAVSSNGDLKAAEQRLAEANAAYHMSLEENNNLKLQLDNELAKVNIDKIAKKQLGLQKVSSKRTFSIDMSELQ